MVDSASLTTPFSLLPKTRTPWTEFAFSSATQACLVAFLIWLRLMHPTILSTPEHAFRSVQLVSVPSPVNHAPQPAIRNPLIAAHVDPNPSALRLPAPQPRPAPKVQENAPAVQIAPKKLEAIAVNVAPVIPRAVRTNVFSTGSSAAPSIARPATPVETGGFGDPNGVPAQSNPGKAVNIAALGSFDLPSGAGSGNGSGGRSGIRGVVASSGFGNGIATGDNRPRNSANTIQQGGFGDADVPAPPAPRVRSSDAPAPVVPAEIVSKPAPVYTQEARNLRIEGEVLLEVVLGASGDLRVLRVVRGLGHGLDDNAVKAAQQIQFKPATRNGQPADSTVFLHIVFQLA
jgi:TonB family protein